MRVVRVFRAVDSRQDVTLTAGNAWNGALSGHNGITDLQTDISHDVTHEYGSGGQALVGQVRHRVGGGGQAQVRGVICQDTVVFFRHASIEGTQPCFQVGHS